MAGLGAPSGVPLTTDVVGVSSTLASSATDGEGALWLEYAHSFFHQLWIDVTDAWKLL